MSETLRKKVLKAPDFFQRTFAVVLRWIEQHQRQVWAGIGVIGLITLAMGGWKYWEGRRAVQLFGEFAEVDKSYRAELKRVREARSAVQKKIDELRSKQDKPATAAAGQPSPAPNPALEALEKERDGISEDHSASLPGFLALYDKHSRDSVGWAAGAHAVGIYLQQDRRGDAKALVQRLLKDSIAEPFYQVDLRWTLIALLEEEGGFDEALQEAETLLALVPEDLKGAALLAKGRLQYFKKDLSGARETLKAIMEKNKDSPEADIARGLLLVAQAETPS